MARISFESVSKSFDRDRIVIMKDGFMQQVGRPLELYDRPCNVFVAAFIGSPEMNLFAGELVRHEGKLHVRAGGFECALPENEFSDSRQAVTIGIRPEHIARARDQPDVNLHVDIVEQIGAQTYVIGTVFGQRVRAVFDRDDQLKADMNVPVNLPALRLHVFSRESGMSLRSSIPQSAQRTKESP